MKLAVTSPRIAKLETWWLYLDHGSFFSGWRRTRARGTGSLTGQVEDGQGESQLHPSGAIITQRASFSFLLTPPISFGFVFNVVQARLKLAL